MIYAISDNKNFGFSRSYVYCIISKFGNYFLASTNMWYWGRHIVFNTGIRNDKYSILINEWIFVNAIEFVLISDYYVGVFLINWMKIKIIRKSVY